MSETSSRQPDLIEGKKRAPKILLILHQRGIVYVELGGTPESFFASATRRFYGDGLGSVNSWPNTRHFYIVHRTARLRALVSRNQQFLSRQNY